MATSDRLYTFYSTNCRMYTFYNSPIECILSTSLPIECIHSTTFYILYNIYNVGAPAFSIISQSAFFLAIDTFARKHEWYEKNSGKAFTNTTETLK